jgi:hypothetical protein
MFYTLCFVYVGFYLPGVFVAAARLQSSEYYIAKRCKEVLKATKDRPLLEECREEERQRGSLARQYW